MNWVFAMNGAGKDPSNSGDWSSWFFFYKWEVGGEVWLPITDIVTGGGQVCPGDQVWLYLESSSDSRLLLGLATITRIEENHSTGKFELWYDDDKVKRVPPSEQMTSFSGELSNEFVQQVPEALNQTWIRKLHATPS